MVLSILSFAGNAGHLPVCTIVSCTNSRKGGLISPPTQCTCQFGLASLASLVHTFIAMQGTEGLLTVLEKGPWRPSIHSWQLSSV